MKSTIFMAGFNWGAVLIGSIALTEQISLLTVCTTLAFAIFFSALAYVEGRGDRTKDSPNSTVA